MTTRSMPFTAVSCLAAAIAAPTAVAAPQDADERAMRVLEAMTEFYGGLEHFSGILTVTAKAEVPGMPSYDIRNTMSLAAERPNRFALRLTEGEGVTTVCDGEQLYNHAFFQNPMLEGETLNVWERKGAPQTFADLADLVPPNLTPTGGMEMHFIVNLLSEDPVEMLTEDAQQVEYGGTARVDGIECHRIRFAQESNGVAVDLFIEAGPEAWVHRVTPDLTGFLEQVGGGTMEIDMRFEGWSAVALTDDDFAFTPPANAERVDSVMDSMMEAMSRGGGGAPEPPADVTSMVGEEAPTFEATLLGGDRVSLSDCRGKVVVIDFWATWCGPCRRGLPVIDAVTSELSDRGVVFYAVDIAEDADTVRTCMEANDWDFDVIMDPDAAIAQMYRVGPIPHTVIIGPDGVVAHVHVGFSPNLRERLTGELEALLD